MASSARPIQSLDDRTDCLLAADILSKLKYGQESTRPNITPSFAPDFHYDQQDSRYRSSFSDRFTQDIAFVSPPRPHCALSTRSTTGQSTNSSETPHSIRESTQGIESEASPTSQHLPSVKSRRTKKKSPRVEGKPQQSEKPDEATAQAIAEALNEYGTRGGRQRSYSTYAPSKPSTPKTVRPAMSASPSPANASFAESSAFTSEATALKEPAKSETTKPAPKPSKKGVAKKPPPLSKKRKTNDGGSVIASPAPSSAASSKKKGGAVSARKVSQSATPAPAAQHSDTESVEDENVIYCICRKPDNHTWMIGCDGGCEDWFHGKCVGVKQEDEELIDRYICPNCTERGVGVTTWKPMCRRPGCNRPARLKKGSESKYCSTACGEDFFKEQLASNATPGTKRPGAKKRQRQEMETDDEVEANPLGGALQGSALKSIVTSIESATAFRRLGSPEALTPPQSRPGTSHGQSDTDLKLNEHENTRFSKIEARKDALRNMRVGLKEREDFVRLTRERAARAKERNGGKAVCGYDSRLAWDEITLQEWRQSSTGQAALEKGTLSPPPEDVEQEGAKICERKTCGRHGGWAKLALQEVRFDEEQVREEMKTLLVEEEGIKRSAQGRKERAEAGAEHEVHGWVEVVD